MAYSSPATQSSGNVATAAYANTLKAATDYLANPPACRCTHSSTQSVTSGTRLALLFNTEEFDTDTMHSTVSNTSRITFNTAGIYVVTGSIEFAASNTTGVRQLEIRANGSDANIYAIQSFEPVAAARQATVTLTRKFAVSDYVELTFFQNSGSSWNVGTGSYTPIFSAVWVGLG